MVLLPIDYTFQQRLNTPYGGTMHKQNVGGANHVSQNLRQLQLIASVTFTIRLLKLSSPTFSRYTVRHDTIDTDNQPYKNG